MVEENRGNLKVVANETADTGQDFHSFAGELVSKLKKGESVTEQDISELKKLFEVADESGTNFEGEAEKVLTESAVNDNSLEKDRKLGAEVDNTAQQLLDAIVDGDAEKARELLSKDQEKGEKAEKSAEDLAKAA